MSLELEQVVVDARDPVTPGRWWHETVRWIIVNDDPDEFEIQPQADRLIEHVRFRARRSVSAPTGRRSLAKAEVVR